MVSRDEGGAIGLLVVGGGFVLFLDYILHGCGHRWFGFVDLFDPRCKFSVWGNLGLDAARRGGGGGGAGETQMEMDCATGSQGIGTCHTYPNAANCFKATCSWIDGGKPYCICGDTCAKNKQAAIDYCYQMAGVGGGSSGSGGGGGGGIKHGVPNPPKHITVGGGGGIGAGAGGGGGGGITIGQQPVGTARAYRCNEGPCYCWKGSCANPSDIFVWCAATESAARQGFIDECHRRLGMPPAARPPGAPTPHPLTNPVPPGYRTYQPTGQPDILGQIAKGIFGFFANPFAPRPIEVVP